MRYHDITKDDMKNGEGLRAVLWVSGCAHACPGCQNPVTWDPNDGLIFDDAAKEELFELLSRDYMSGLTLSGGDPLFPENRDDILKLVKEIKAKFPDKSIWCYTGYTWEEICKLPVVKYLDVIVDGKFILELKDNKLSWKGSSNQRVIDVKASIREGKGVLYA